MERTHLLAVGSMYALERAGGVAPGGMAPEAALHGQSRGAVCVPIARVGMDRFGRDLIEALRTAGLDVGSIQVDPDLPTPRRIERGGTARMEAYAAFDTLQFDADVEGLARAADAIVTDACSRRHGQGRSAIDRVLTTGVNAARGIDLVRRTPQDERLDRECVGNALELAQIFVVDPVALRTLVPAVAEPIAAAERFAGSLRGSTVALLMPEATILRGRVHGEGRGRHQADSHRLLVDLVLAVVRGTSLVEALSA